MKGSFVNAIKYFLFAANILVFIMSCVSCGFGSFTLIDARALTHLVLYVDRHSSVNQFATASVLLIVVSMMVMFVTFLGCCGAIQGNRCMLVTYFSFTLALFVFVIVSAALGASKSLLDLKEPLLKSIARYDPRSQDPNVKRLTTSWDNFQKDFECCGVVGPTDWTANPAFRAGNDVPESCCRPNSRPADSALQQQQRHQAACPTSPANSARLMVQGCFGRADERLRKDSADIMAVAVTLIVLMFLDMILAFAMCMVVAK